MGPIDTAGLLAPTIEQEEEREAWHTRDGEPARAYAGFCSYRDLGPTRSLDAAYARHTNKKRASTTQNGTKRASSTFRELSVKWDWHSRATAWDIREDERRLREGEAASRKLLEEHGERSRRLAVAQHGIAARGLLKISRALDDMEAKPQRIGPKGEVIEAEPEKIIPPADIPRWIRAMAALGEAATGAEAQVLSVGEILRILAPDYV